MDKERLKKLLNEQDDRYTADPIFLVQRKVIIYGMDSDYASSFCYASDDGDGHSIFSGDEYEELDRKFLSHQPLELEEQGTFNRVGYKENWEFVTACFTEQGCKDYIRRNGHNCGETRIYADSAYRNQEWIEMREYLMKGE